MDDAARLSRAGGACEKFSEGWREYLARHEESDESFFIFMKPAGSWRTDMLRRAVYFIGMHPGFRRSPGSSEFCFSRIDVVYILQ
jgi:hypothetical protein